MKFQDPFERIETIVAEVRRRLDHTAAAEAAWTGIVLVVAGLLSGLAVALILGQGPGRLGWIPIGIGLMAATVFAWRTWWRPRLRRADDQHMARWIEARVEGLESGVITAIQAGQALRDERSWPGLDAGLARLSADVTVRHLSAVDATGLVDRGRLAQITRVGLAVVAAAAICVMVGADDVRRGARALVASPPENTLSIIDVDAAVGDLAFQLSYPAYLGLQPREIPRTGGDVSALVGTEIQLTGSALFPTQAALLLLESDPEGRWPLQLSEDGVIRGTLRVGETDRYRFALVTPEGDLLRERGWRSVEARRDQPPTVRLLLPERDLEVDPKDEVSLLYDAIDDHGLGDIALLIDRGDGKPAQRRLLDAANGDRTARGTAGLLVGPLDLQPGESVEVWFEATDLNTVDGPARGQSPTRRITMYSPEAEHEERLADIEALIDQLVDVLADRLESPVDERVAAQVGVYLNVQMRLSAKGGLVLGTFEQLVAAISTDSLATDGMRDRVRAIYDRLQSHHEIESAQLRQAKAGTSATRRPDQMVKVLYEYNEEGVGELEVGILELKDLLDRARQDRVLEQGRELLETQNELMDLLDQLKDGANTEAALQAERKLQELERKLREMEAEMRRMAERMPYENQNNVQKPSDEEVDMRTLRDRMAEVRRLIEEGRIEEAMKLLEKLNQETQEMMAALQNDFGADMQMAASERKMNDFNVDLAEVVDNQRGLEGETAEEERRQQEAQQQEAMERLAEEVDSARDKAKAIEEKLAEAPDDVLHPADQEALAELRDRARHLREEVERLELETAREQARNVSKECNGLGGEVGASEERELDMDASRKMRSAKGALEESGELASELAEELEELARKMGPGPPSAQDRENSQRLGQQQKQLQRKLGELGEQLGELDGEMPGLKESLEPALGEARVEMGKASDKLGGVKPGAAAGHQRRALQKLGEAQQSIEQRIKQSKSQRDGGMGVNDPHRKVQIPDADDYRAPEAFRKELLKAMRERAPERFDKANERYYQELVK